MNQHRHQVTPPSLGYFALVAMLLALVLAMVPGCAQQDSTSGTGSVASRVLLDNPSPTTGHAGVLMFLAGTSFQARTDQQGRYRIDGIPAGTYELVAEKEGFEGQTLGKLMVDPAKNTFDNPLQPPQVTLASLAVPAPTPSGNAQLGTVEGQVLLENMIDDHGGVRVELNETGFVTVSSKTGQYRLLNVEPGTYTLSFYKDGYRPYTSDQITVTTGVTQVKDEALELLKPGDVASPQAAAAVAALQASAPPAAPEPPPGPTEPRSIVGTVEVRDENNQLLQNYEDVTVGINGTSNVADINELGQFRFDNLTSGTYTLIGTIGQGGAVVQVPVDLESQKTATVIVKLGGPPAQPVQGNGTITGKVALVDMDGKALPDSSGVQVAVNGTQAMATTAADGAFTLSAVPVGTYTVTATKESFEPGQMADVAVTTTGTMDLGTIEMAMKVDRPRVISTDPADSAKDVAVGFDLPIAVKFSQKMNIESVRQAISISPNTPFTALMGKGAAPGADDDTLIIKLSNDDPKAPIQFAATYRLSIAESAANVDGVTMEKAYSWSFRTANPGIMQAFPESGATRVMVDQLNNPVLFTFNTRLDPDTINDRNIRVKPDNGISVSTTYTDSEVKGWTTVRVATQWQPDTNYTVTVSRRVKAFNGQSLGNTPYTIRFHTAPIEVMSVPILQKR